MHDQSECQAPTRPLSTHYLDPPLQRLPPCPRPNLSTKHRLLGALFSHLPSVDRQMSPRARTRVYGPPPRFDNRTTCRPPTRLTRPRDPSNAYAFPSGSIEMSISPSQTGAPPPDLTRPPRRMPSLTGESLNSSAHHRISLSGRPRRPSPLLHEIQGPSRRLSAHQMLLLTPFGGALPPAADMAPGLSMTRTSSAMAPLRSSLSSSRPAPTGPAIVQDPLRPRTRHHSLLAMASAGLTPSPLSQPMSTIVSASSGRSGLTSAQISRQASEEVDHDEDQPTLLVMETMDEAMSAGPGSTVPMTRSNSLPVLTQREVEALREKDGELGITRGGDFAWVSHDTADETDDSYVSPCA